MSLKNALFLSTALLAACGQIQSNPNTAAAPVSPEHYEGMQFDGTYVGVPYTTAGACNDILREMVIVVKRSHASLVWNIHNGHQLLGEVSPDGAVDMHSQHETYLLDLKGRIDGDTLTAKTSSTSSHGDCAYGMTMVKRDLEKAP